MKVAGVRPPGRGTLRGAFLLPQKLPVMWGCRVLSIGIGLKPDLDGA